MVNNKQLEKGSLQCLYSNLRIINILINRTTKILILLQTISSLPKMDLNQLGKLIGKG